MADLTQQYLDILRGYGVDTSTLQYADPAKLKRIVDQTRQASDTGGGAMAVGQQAAQQAAKDVIGGTTPRKGLEDLLKEAHTGSSITQAGSDAALPMSEVPAMSAPRELAIRQDPGGPQSQGDINQPTSLGVKTSTATLRPDTVTGEVPAPGMELQPGIYDHLPAYEPTEDLITKAMTGPTIKQAASDTVLPMSEATVQPLAVDARIEERRLRREQEQEAARLAKQPKAQIAPGQTLTLAEGPAEKKKKNMLQTLAGIEVVKPGAEDWGTQFEGATREELDTVGRQVLGQDVENVRDGGTPMTTFEPDAWSSKGVDPRVADIWGELTGAEKEQYLLKYGGSEKEIIRAIEENVLPSGAPRVQRDAAVQRPLTPVSAQKADTTDLTMDTPDDVDAMGMDLEGMAPPEKAGLLSRLGGFAQDNPELLAQIAQAGGGFMQNIAQGRAQKKADAKTRGAMAQSNLIGALTGGKSRPAVMREEAEQGGLLARLGQAVQAGGSVAGGEMKRRTALSQRDEEMDLKGRKVAAGERQGDLMSRRLGIMQDKINKEYEINDKAAQVALAKATGASYERVQGGIESLNKATNIYKGGGYLDPTQGAKNLYGQMRVLYNDYDKDATPANVGAIFQVYQRFFDPATVREGDLKILQEAEGTFRRIQAQAERLVGAGGSLSSDTVEEMKRITDKVHSMQARKATEDVNAYISTALDPRDREATSEYYDRIFKMPSLSDSGDKGDLVKDLGQTEIKL